MVAGSRFRCAHAVAHQACSSILLMEQTTMLPCNKNPTPSDPLIVSLTVTCVHCPDLSCLKCWNQIRPLQSIEHNLASSIALSKITSTSPVTRSDPVMSSLAMLKLTSSTLVSDSLSEG
eukprot:3799722-Rhodomonas_salina.1